MSHRNVVASQYSYMLLFGLFETSIFYQRYHYQMDLDDSLNIDKIHLSRLSELEYQRTLNRIISKATHHRE